MPRYILIVLLLCTGCIQNHKDPEIGTVNDDAFHTHIFSDKTASVTVFTKGRYWACFDDNRGGYFCGYLTPQSSS